MKRKIFLILTITLLSINTSLAQGYYAPDEQVNISVYEKISPAIVAIEAQVKDGVSAGTGCIGKP